MKKKLSIGFSPCPNDTFIFDALVNGKIDTHGLELEVILEDVQTLNRWALEGRLDITKISYATLPLILNEYKVLDAGGALGSEVGPLLVSKDAHSEKLPGLEQAIIAIPGAHTTAHLLFSLAFPRAMHKMFMVFSEIEEAVATGKVDAGVIIHENRFTYADKGLHKWMDLGEYWEGITGMPIPLGGIVMKKDWEEQAREINDLIRESLAYARKQYPVLGDYVKYHAQEMSEDVMRQHIELYVNDHSVSLGADGQAAVRKLLEVFDSLNATQSAQADVFFDLDR